MGRQAGTGFPAERVADRQQRAAMSAGLSPIGRSDERESLREDLALTISYATIKAMRPQTDPNDLAVARKVAQRAAIPTVHVTRPDSTSRTTCVIRAGCDHQRQDTSLMNYII
jgi:hypothetical protein